MARAIVAMASKNSVALDQWRGVAMALVLVSHGFYYSGHVNGVGRIGINLFFVISGVLVYRSLAGSEGMQGARLALDFWWRRLRRLYPALVAFVVLMLPVTLVFEEVPPAEFGLEVERYLRTVPSALFYTLDYWPSDPPNSLGHLWSVALEMQFFLIAPLIFLLGGRSRIRRLAVWGGLLAALLVAGVLAPVLDPSGVDKYQFQYAAWPMMLGFCCEHLRDRLANVPRRLVALFVSLSLLLFATGLVIAVIELGPKTLVVASGTFVLVPCVFAYALGQEIVGAPGKVLTWLGQRTYSIYLWQQPLTICTYLPVVLHPLGAALATLVGGLSFRLFEQPFLSPARRRMVRR